MGIGLPGNDAGPITEVREGMHVMDRGGVEPDLGPQLSARLLGTGFLKVDGKGLFDRDFYVAADEIDEVVGDRVRLSVPRERLAAEGS